MEFHETNSESQASCAHSLSRSSLLGDKRFNFSAYSGRVHKASLRRPTRLSHIARAAPALPDDESVRQQELREFMRRQAERQQNSEAEIRHRAVARAAQPAAHRSQIIPHAVVPTSPESKVLEVGDHRVKVGRELGRGGYSVVYSVIESITRKKYALKVVNLRNIDIPQVKQNLLEEVRLLKDLANVERVVQLISCEVSDVEVLMLMEQGSSDLSQLLNLSADHPLDISFVRYWGGQMLKAVAAIHRHSIVHSDLKPANFLVVAGDLKLCDFGIANKVPSNATSVQRSIRIGTCYYMAPETHKEYQRIAVPQPRQLSQPPEPQTQPAPKSSSSKNMSFSKWLVQQNTRMNLMPDDSGMLGDAAGEPPSMSSDSSVSGGPLPSNIMPNTVAPSAVAPNVASSSVQNEDCSCADGNRTIYKVTKASDVWSCGIILYEMVYKMNPVQYFLDRHDPEELVHHVIEHPTVGKGGINVPLMLHEVIRDCLKIQPEQRISADEACNSLFFLPIGVDEAAVHSIVKSAARYGYELGKQAKEIKPEKLEARALKLFKRLDKLSNGGVRDAPFSHSGF